MVDSNQHIWKKHGINPVVVNINCAKYGTAGTNLRNLIMEDIASQCSLPFTQGNAGKVVQSALESTRWNSRKHLVILVLDEIDQLVDAESEAENAKTQGEKLLENLSEWSQNSRLVLVGIGNSMNNTRYRRADRFVKVSVFCLNLLPISIPADVFANFFYPIFFRSFAKLSLFKRTLQKTLRKF